MTAYSVRTGDIDTDVNATSPREALELALQRRSLDAAPGELAEVDDGHPDGPVYLPTKPALEAVLLKKILN